MKFSKEIVINAPAEKVWDIIGHRFTDVGQWARSITSSVINHDAEKVGSSPVGGRVCETSIGHISEEFITYDEEGMNLSFRGMIISKMFDSVISTNLVTKINENTSKVTITPSIDLTFIGMLMYPLIKVSLSKTLNEVLDDLKYFSENDEPSPHKVKAMRK
jgi:hypothetical protein